MTNFFFSSNAKYCIFMQQRRKSSQFYALIVVKVFIWRVYPETSTDRTKKLSACTTKKKKSNQGYMEIYGKYREHHFSKVRRGVEAISRVVKQRSLSRWSKLHLWFPLLALSHNARHWSVLTHAEISHDLSWKSNRSRYERIDRSFLLDVEFFHDIYYTYNVWRCWNGIVSLES